MYRKIMLLCACLCFAPAAVLAGEVMFPEGVRAYNRAVKEQKAGRYEEAFSHYQNALLIMGQTRKTDIFRAYILNNAAVIIARKGDPAEAERMFLESLELYPKYRNALLNLGILYNRQGESAKAIRVWSQVMELPAAYTTEGEKDAVQ